MNRSKRSSKSIPLEDKGTSSAVGDVTLVDGLPPNGKSNRTGGNDPNPQKSTSVGNTEPGSSSMSNPNPSSPGTGEKKKKFSFFSNLFKSNKPPTENDGKGRQSSGGKIVQEDGMTSASSYESVNSVDTMSSFTFVSSKKLRGKGQKGKRIPMDEPTPTQLPPPRPNSSCSSGTGIDQNNSRPESAVEKEKEKSNTLNRAQPHSKKLGTLGRIGIKMGLKKKYNLQSCESLEHLGSLPRQPVVVGGKKKGGKKFVGPVSPRTSTVIEDDKALNSVATSDSEKNSREKVPNIKETQCKEEKEVSGVADIPLMNTAHGENHEIPESNPVCSNQPNEKSRGKSLEDEIKLTSDFGPLPTSSINSDKSPEPVACSSKSILQEENGRLSPSGYTSDVNTNTWSSSTKRKRRAPAPPANNQSSISCNVIQIPGQKQDNKAGVNNVELKSVKRLGEDTQTPTTSSYPSGALRRRKSKEKSHSRPYSYCSCSNSIFAHHSKYQTYHRRCCIEGHGSHNNARPSTASTSNADSNNGGTLGRSHVKGKKKAPPPPPSNPFEEDLQIEEQTSSKPKKDRNPENPYSNPFLDDDSDGNNNEPKTDRENVTEIGSSGIMPVISTSSSAHNSTATSRSDELSSSVVIPTPLMQNGSGGIWSYQRSRNTPASKTTELSPSERFTTTVAPTSSNVGVVNKNTTGPVTSISSQAATITTSSSSTQPIASISTTRSSPPAQTVPGEDHEVTSAEDDEIAQNLLNDRQEQELLASVQGSLSLPTSPPINVANAPPTSASPTSEPESVNPSAPFNSKSNNSSSGSKRIFNFSRNRDSNSHLQPDEASQNDMETLLNSSPTLMAQVKAVDDQVKAQLQNSSNKKQGGFFTPKSKKSTQPKSPLTPLSPPLSPKFQSPLEDSTETKAAAPRPWYKRSISSSSSPSKSPSGTRVKPTPVKLTHLTKFSDLDREAQRIVDENKRKSAELAFNQNARDLINIFNTAFTTAPSSSTTTTSTVTVASVEGSGDPTGTPGTTSTPTSSITSTFLSMANTANASTSRSYLGRGYASKGTESTTDQKNIAVVQPQKNSGHTPTTSTVPTSTDTKVSVTPTPATSMTTSLSIGVIMSPIPTTSSASLEPIVSSSSTVSLSSPKLTTTVSTMACSTTSTNTSAITPKPVIGESWSCPRCTLRNPAWRALCEACYYRKFGANAINTTTASNASSTTVSSTTFSTPISPLTTSSPSKLGSRPSISNNATITCSNQSQSPPTSTKMASATQTENSSSSINNNQTKSAGSKPPPSCENFLYQLPAKEDLLKDEKLQGIRLSNGASITSTNTQSQDEIDVEKLRQVRLAFFNKEQQGRRHNQSMNLNIQLNDPDSEDEVAENSISSNSNQNVLSETSISAQQIKPMSSTTQPQKFDDGEDDSIDAMLFQPMPQNDPPKRPPKNNTSQLQNSAISPDAGPNFDILLQPHSNVPQAYSSPPHSPSATANSPNANGPAFRFRPMLEAITESDANYYTSIPNDDEVDRPVYQNWQQPATAYQHQQPSLTESPNGNAYPLFIPSPNLHNTSAVHPHLFMRQNIASPADSLASHSFVTTTPNANFRLFSNPIPPNHPAQNYNDQENSNAGFDLGSAFPSNSHFLNSGFTSESEPEADSDMDRHRRRERGYSSRDRDNRYWNGHGGSGRSSAGYPEERNLSYDDYRRLGAIPKGYGYSGGSGGFGDSQQQRRFEGGGGGGGSGPGSSSDSGRRRHPGFNHPPSSRSQYGDDDDSRYFSESSENSMADNPLVASKLLRKLEWAIAHGEHRLAASLAHDLALLKVNCVVSKPSTDPITIRIYVEDRAMQQGPFLVQVLPTMTLKDLKSKIEGDWGIPAGFQKWILGKKMAEDDFITLANYDVVQDTMTFLYLVTPQIENLGGKKDKEITPPPPPLPKKPLSSPSPISQQRSTIESTASSGSHHPPSQMNQLGTKMTPMSPVSAPSSKKIASSAQTDDNSLSGPIKARMPDPVDDKKVPLYERPRSPTRGERSTPAGKNIPKENGESIRKDSSQPKTSNMGSSNNDSAKMQEKNKMATYGESQEQIKSSATATSARSQSPAKKSTSSMSNSASANNIKSPNNLPLSLHAKLENLRLAAEQAFGKSFSSAQQPSTSQGTCSSVGPSVGTENQQKHLPPTSTAFTQQSPTTNNKPNEPSPSSSQPGPSLPQKKQMKLPATPMQQSDKLTNAKLTQNKSATPSQERRQVSKPEQSITCPGSSQTGSNNNTNQLQRPKEDTQQPGTSKSAKIVPSTSTSASKPENSSGSSSTPADTPLICKSEPVPKPRTKKSTHSDPDSETEKIINLAHHQQVTTGIEEATVVVTAKPEKVEGFCQTTLPFPGVKGTNKSEEQPPKPTAITGISQSSTISSESTNPTPPARPPSRALSPATEQCLSASASSKTGSEIKQSSTMIIGNVLVSPILNHVLLGTSALLRSLSPPPPSPYETESSSSIQNSSTNDVTSTNAINDRKPDEVSASQPSSSSPTVGVAKILGSPAKSPKIQRGVPNGKMPTMPPQPLPLPPNNPSTKLRLNQPKPFKLPYFMQQLCAEELKNNQKPRSPPSKVKMIAEKFNSSSYSTTNQSSAGLLQRKFSDASNIHATNNYVSSQVIGRRKSETAVGTILTFSDESKESNIQTYLSMLQMMEKQDLILSTDEFECPVCLTGVASGDGVTLRDCLHNFCKDCLIGAVQYAEDSEVKCPFRDDSYSCESPLQEREIKALVPPEVFEKYLTRSVRLAERKMMNTFHCKTADCPGWCIFEDDVNIFKCPVCQKKNCITCAAIHVDMDCQQYQRQLAIAAETDEDAKSSRLMLEKMIQKGDALECPACHVVLLKKWGCDWVRCTYCKTEICWITRKLRWGPGGRGDVSGGCKCGLNGIKCHPKCTYCH